MLASKKWFWMLTVLMLIAVAMGVTAVATNRHGKYAVAACALFVLLLWCNRWLSDSDG